KSNKGRMLRVRDRRSFQRICTETLSLSLRSKRIRQNANLLESIGRLHEATPLLVLMRVPAPTPPVRATVPSLVNRPPLLIVEAAVSRDVLVPYDLLLFFTIRGRMKKVSLCGNPFYHDSSIASYMAHKSSTRT